MELTSASLAEIDLFVTGDKRKVDPLNPRDLVASLDLTQMSPGDRIIQLTPSNVVIDLPTGVSLDSIEPTQIPIKLERIIIKDLPIEPNFIGSPRNGLEFYSSETNPKTVRVRGPEGIVAGLTSLSSERIDLRDRTESFVVNQLNLTNDNQRVRLLIAAVNLKVTIGPKRTLKVFELPIAVNGKNKTVVITLYGPAQELRDLDPETLKIVNPQSSKPEVVLPDNLKASVEVRKIQIR
jgi:YbbR domain-containing protein